MTKEEAKNILRNAAWLGTHDERNKTEEAVDMAIQALSQEPCEGCDYKEWLKGEVEQLRCEDGK